MGRTSRWKLRRGAKRRSGGGAGKSLTAATFISRAEKALRRRGCDAPPSKKQVCPWPEQQEAFPEVAAAEKGTCRKESSRSMHKASQKARRQAAAGLQSRQSLPRREGLTRNQRRKQRLEQHHAVSSNTFLLRRESSPQTPAGPSADGGEVADAATPATEARVSRQSEKAAPSKRKGEGGGGDERLQKARLSQTPADKGGSLECKGKGDARSCKETPSVSAAGPPAFGEVANAPPDLRNCKAAMDKLKAKAQ